MTNAELINLFRNVEQSNHPVCNGCPMKYTCDKNQITRCLFGTAADALEAAEQRIAIVEEERDLERFAAKNYLDKIDELKAQMPKEGEWKKILQNGDGTSDYQCSACLGIIMNVPDDDEHSLCSFCPNCGARMKWKPTGRGANNDKA